MSTEVVRPPTLDVMKGVQLRVSRAMGGVWYAYVSLPPGAPMTQLNGGPHHAHALGDGNHRNPYWTSVAGQTEGEARRYACDILGYVYGKRLAAALAPVKIPASVAPAPREVVL